MIRGILPKEECDPRFIIPYLCSRSRKEIPSEITLEYTHDAEKHERNAAINSGVVESINFSGELDIWDSAIMMHLKTNSKLFSSRDWSIIWATSMACNTLQLHVVKATKLWLHFHIERNQDLVISKQVTFTWENLFWNYAVVSRILDNPQIHQ